MLRKVPGARSLRGCGTTTWPGLAGCLNLAWSPLPPARTQPSRSSRLMIAALFMVCNFTHPAAGAKAVCSSLSPFIGPERPRSSDGPDGAIFPRSPRGSEISAKRFRPGGRMAPPSPFSPLASFGSVVAGRSRGCRPSRFLPGDRLWVFGNRVAGRSRSRWRWRAFGEGLGGAPPPNERAVSEANSFVAPQ